MGDAATRLREAVIDRVVNGPGQAPAVQRRAAFTGAIDGAGLAAPAQALLAKVAQNAWKVTDEDVAGAVAAGLTEDQVFELVVSAALGQANRQLASALDAVDAAERGEGAEAAAVEAGAPAGREVRA